MNDLTSSKKFKNIFRTVLAGIGSAPLKKFLQQRKRLLIMGSVQLDNVPRTPEKIYKLVAELPLKGRHIFLDWLLENAPEGRPNIEEALRAATVDGVHEFDPVLRGNVAWTILISLLSEPMQPIMEQYLSVKDERDVGKSTASISEVQQEPTDDHAEEFIFEEDHDEVIASCKLVRQDKSFAVAEVLGVRRGKRFIRLDSDQKVEAFPLLGDIIITASRGERLPVKDEIGVWSVVRGEQKDEHLNKFKTATVTPIASVYGVKNIAASSDDPDAVREEIKKSKFIPNSRAYIFVSSDKQYFYPRNHSALSISDFSEPLDSWRNLEIIDTAAGEVVIGPLPKAELLYDCSELSVAFRRVLQQAKSFGRTFSFAKNTIPDLAKWIDEESDIHILPARRQRLLNRLSEITVQAEFQNDLYDLLLNLPTVKAEIALRIAAERDRLFVDRSSIAAEIDAHRRELEHLKRGIDSQHVKLKDVNQRVTRQIRKAFDRAVEEGEDRLGDVAVFSAIFGPKSNAGDRSHLIPPASGQISVSGLSLETFPSAASVFMALGFPRSTAATLEKLLEIVRSAGLAIAFTGHGANFVAEEIAKSYSRSGGLLVSVHPGASSPDVISTLLSESQTDALCILRANSSSFDAYGCSVEAFLWGRLLNPEAPRSMLVVMSLIKGFLAIPLSHSIRVLIVQIDLDDTFGSDDAGLDITNWESETFDKLQAAFSPPSIFKKILKLISKQIPPDAQSATLTLLQSSILGSFIENKHINEG